MSSHHPPPAERGFTTIELLTTIAILAILVAMAIPSMTRFAAEWRVSNAANALMGALRVARTEAVAHGRTVVLCRTTSANPTTCTDATSASDYSSGWIVFVDDNGNRTFDNGETLLMQQDPLPAMAGLAPNIDNVRITFLPSGIMRLVDSAGNLETDAAGQPRRLAIDVRSSQFTSNTETPWAVKAICLQASGRVVTPLPPNSGDASCN